MRNPIHPQAINVVFEEMLDGRTNKKFPPPPISMLVRTDCTSQLAAKESIVQMLNEGGLEKMHPPNPPMSMLLATQVGADTSRAD